MVSTRNKVDKCHKRQAVVEQVCRLSLLFIFAMAISFVLLRIYTYVYMLIDLLIVHHF